MQEETPLQALIAKYRYHTDFAELDLSDINRQCYPDDDALIHLIARVGGPDEIQLLTASGARINAIGDMGYTPLHYATMKGRIEVANKLLALGADPSIRNELGDTPMDAAINGSHADMIKLLKRHIKFLKRHQ